MRGRALLLGLVGLAAWAILGVINMRDYPDVEGHTAPGGIRDFFLTYQVSFVFWMSVPIGAMALGLLGHIVSASWGLVFRRIFQAAMRCWPLFAVFFIVPVISLFMGEASPFWWVIPADKIPEFNTSEYVLKEQSHRQDMYLNINRFLITAGLVFALYWWLMSKLNTWGVKSEDEHDYESWSKLRRLGGPGFILWALTFTVIITDWVMSVEPAWFSTMFPVVAAMNCFLTTFAFSALVLYTLIGGNDTVLHIVKMKFRIDIGSLMYGFTMVWTYATFSQYMLIWAGNMPEEIIYYKKRLEGGWQYMAYALMVIHWFLPFVILLFREVKTDPRKMRRMTVLLLAICMLDVIWWIVPTYTHPGWAHVPMAIAAIAGLGGIFAWAFFGQLAKRNLLPKRDTEFLATWGEHH